MGDQHDKLDEVHTLELLDRYLLGEHQGEGGTSDPSISLALSPEEMARVGVLQKLWRAPHQDPWSVENRLRVLHHRLNLGEVQPAPHRTVGAGSTSTPPVVPQIATARSWRAVRYRVAAAVAGGLILAVGLRMASRGTSDTHTVTGTTKSSHTSYTTANGQRATVTLADGTTVVLNVGSQLDIPTNYGVTTRSLRLSGEAHFSVKHSKGIPLTVTAGPGTATVLGTQFVVRHYATDTAAIIAVQEGKVAVQSTVLTANQEVLVQGMGVVHMQTATVNRVSFAKGQLILNNVTLHDAISELNRWYNIDIRLGDSTLGSEQLMWKSPEGSISDVVSILELALPVRVDRDGRTLTIYPR